MGPQAQPEDIETVWARDRRAVAKSSKSSLINK